MHEYAPLAITLVAIFAGILVNKADLKELKADMVARFADINTRFDRIEAKQDRMQADLAEFYRVLR